MCLWGCKIEYFHPSSKNKTLKLAKQIVLLAAGIRLPRCNVQWLRYCYCQTCTDKYIAINQMKTHTSKHTRWLTKRSPTTETRHLLLHSSPHPMLLNRLVSAPTASFHPLHNDFLLLSDNSIITLLQAIIMRSTFTGQNTLCHKHNLSRFPPWRKINPHTQI